MVQVTIGISRFKWYITKQITIQLNIGKLLAEKQAL